MSLVMDKSESQDECNQHPLIKLSSILLEIHRGYSNVFVKYVFYFSSEVDNIYIS